MADNLTVEQRKKNMQHIKSKDTKIESALRKALRKKDIDIERIIVYYPESRYCSYKISNSNLL